jgi:Domain of unknown function (DUF4177)
MLVSLSGGGDLECTSTSSSARARRIVHEHARDGWRLVQIFAPGVAVFGAAKYYELIFERELPAADNVELARNIDAEPARA